MSEARPVAFVRLDFHSVKGVVERLPENFANAMRPCPALRGMAYDVGSFSGEGSNHKCAVSEGVAGWEGKCACPGWLRTKTSIVGKTPCVHVMAAMLLQDGFDWEVAEREDNDKINVAIGQSPVVPDVASDRPPEPAAPRAPAEEESPFIDPPTLPPRKAKAPVRAKKPPKQASGKGQELVVEAKATTLVGKLAEVMAEVGYIQKDAVNDFHHYRYASAQAVLLKVNAALSSRGIAASSHAYMLHHEFFPPTPLAERVGPQKPADAKPKLYVVIKIEIDFTDGTDTVHAEGIGEASDAADKALMKANTAAIKYLMADTFFISWGADPEADSSVDG